MEPRSSTNHWSSDAAIAGVPGGDVVVVEPDRGVGAATDQERGVDQLGTGALVGALDHEQVAWAGRGGVAPSAGDRGRGAAARAASGTRAPNMSERITEIADSTKIQRIAR